MDTSDWGKWERKLRKLQSTLSTEDKHCFKEKLSKQDRINTEPIVIEITNEESIRPSKEIPLNLREVANQELQAALDAGFLEDHPTKWCSRGLFVDKPNADKLKVRIVSDFRNVNKILKKPGYPMEGSE